MKFQPGQSGNPTGRPKGSRNKLEEDFLRVMYEDWQKNGADVVDRVRQSDPAVYLKVVAQILPKESKVDLTHRVAESLTEEHARMVAEGFLESLRSHTSGDSEEPSRVHDSISAGLQGRTASSPDSKGAPANRKR